MSDHTAQEIAAGEPHHHAPAHPVSAFSDTQRAALHSDDFAAGKAVVVLMLSIFSTGVFIYTIVAFWVIFFSHA